MKPQTFRILIIIIIGAAIIGGGIAFSQKKQPHNQLPLPPEQTERIVEQPDVLEGNSILPESTENIQPSSTPEITPATAQAATIETSSSARTEYAYGNAVITTDNNYRYITSNGIPEHETGQFPNPGNPNAITQQDHDYRVTLNPVATGVVQEARIPGVALNGIPLEPGTAETYNGDTSWSIEAFDADGIGGLGIDWSNAHVQPNGTYHYHGVPEGLLGSALEDQSGDRIQLAWASDGFPIYYSQSNAYQSSWRVKSGTRPDGPGGAYDGTYTQDFEYVAGLGDLDECNGAFVDGEYAYFITNSFPYIQRCVVGTPDASFDRFTGGQGPGRAQSGSTTGREGRNMPPNAPGNAGGPPQEALEACEGKSVNSDCSINTPSLGHTGTCRYTPDNQLACIPG